MLALSGKTAELSQMVITSYNTPVKMVALDLLIHTSCPSHC